MFSSNPNNKVPYPSLNYDYRAKLTQVAKPLQTKDFNHSLPEVNLINR